MFRPRRSRLLRCFLIAPAWRGGLYRPSRVRFSSRARDLIASRRALSRASAGFFLEFFFQGIGSGGAAARAGLRMRGGGRTAFAGGDVWLEASRRGRSTAVAGRGVLLRGLSATPLAAPACRRRLDAQPPQTATGVARSRVRPYTRPATTEDVLLRKRMPSRGVQCAERRGCDVRCPPNSRSRRSSGGPVSSLCQV